MAKVMDSAEDMAAEAEDKNTLAAQNVVATTQYGLVQSSVPAPRSISNKSGISRLGCRSPERVPGNNVDPRKSYRDLKKARSSFGTNVSPSNPGLKLEVKLRPVVVLGKDTSLDRTPSARPPFVLGPLARTRPGPRPAPPKQRGRGLFGACFGGPVPPSSNRSATQGDGTSPGRSQSRRPSFDSKKLELSAADLCKKGAENDAPSAEPTADAKSPSCRRCNALSHVGTSKSHEFKEGHGTGQISSSSAIGGGKSMNNLNKQESDLAGDCPAREMSIATDPGATRVVQEQAESSREAETGVSPIRGLRPNRTAIAQERRIRQNPDADPGPGDGQFLLKPYFIPHEYYDSGRHSGYTPSPPTTSSGVTRLFDAIIGRADYAQKIDQRETARSKSPGNDQPFHRKPRTKSRRPGTTPNYASNYATTHLTARYQGKNRTSNYRIKQPNFATYQAERAGQHRINVPPQDSEPMASSRDHMHMSVDARAAAQTTGQHVQWVDGFSGRQSESGSEPSFDRDPYDGKGKDLDNSRLDHRQRGYPDPSFSPRPGDIIIRARKRPGLRLTDFYYYDNENHMEEGDQILRAKFEYLPPMDTMHLWCRLYVFGADGTYIYVDSTSEVVAKFKSDQDVKTFKEPTAFF